MSTLVDNEDEITKAVAETIALFNYYLAKESHRDKPASEYVSESQEETIEAIANSVL